MSRVRPCLCWFLIAALGSWTTSCDRTATPDIPSLDAWVATEAGPRRLSRPVPLDEGDQVQLRYHTPTGAFATFAGIDDRGLIEIYGTTETDRDTSSWQSAPFSLILDDSPGFQRFVVLFTDQPPGDEEVFRAVRSRSNGHLAEMTFPKRRPL